MAKFSEQISYLVGDVSTYASEVAQALIDANREIVNYMLAYRPDMAYEFSTTDTLTDGSGVALEGYPVLHAIRGVYPCSTGYARLEAQYEDENSIHYATVIDPVYYTKDSVCYIIPAPLNQAGKYGYVTRVVVATNTTGDSTSLEYFPQSLEPALIYRSAMTIADVKLYDEIASVPSAITLPSIPDTAVFTSLTDTVSALSPPAALDFSGLTQSLPDSSNIDFTSVPSVVSFTPPTLSRTAPTFTAPKVGGVTEELTTTISAGAIGSSNTDVSAWFDIVGDYIETEEDTELAAATLQKINSYLSAYSVQLQANVADFNEGVESYRGALNDFQADLQAESNRVSAELQTAQQEINKAIATYEAELGSDYKRFDAERAAEIQEFRANLERAINIFQADVQQFNVEAQRVSVENQSEAQRLSLELQLYASEVQSNSAVFSQNIAKAQLRVQELSAVRARLESAYNRMIQSFFGVANG